MDLEKFSWPGKVEDVKTLYRVEFDGDEYTIADLKFYTNGKFSCAVDNDRAVFGIIDNGNSYDIVPIVDDKVFETLQMNVVEPAVHPLDDKEEIAKFMGRFDNALKSIGCHTFDLKMNKDECSIQADSMEYFYPRESHPTFEILTISATMDLVTARWVQALARKEIVGPLQYKIEGGYNINVKSFDLEFTNKSKAILFLNRTKEHRNPFWNIGDGEINIRYIHAALTYISFVHPELQEKTRNVGGGDNTTTYTSLRVPNI